MFAYIVFKKWFDIKVLFPTWLWLIVIWKITSYFYEIQEQESKKEQIIKEIYNADIAETRLVKNIWDIMSGYTIENLKKYLKDIFDSVVYKIFLYISNFKEYRLETLLIILLFEITFLLNIKIFISKITQFIDEIYQKELWFSLFIIIEKIPSLLINILFVALLIFIFYKIKNHIFYKQTKFVFVIDELDKLLDFEKESSAKKDSKTTVDMSTKYFEN